MAQLLEKMVEDPTTPITAADLLKFPHIEKEEKQKIGVYCMVSETVTPPEATPQAARNDESRFESQCYIGSTFNLWKRSRVHLEKARATRKCDSESWDNKKHGWISCIGRFHLGRSEGGSTIQDVKVLPLPPKAADLQVVDRLVARAIVILFESITQLLLSSLDNKDVRLGDGFSLGAPSFEGGNGHFAVSESPVNLGQVNTPAPDVDMDCPICGKTVNCQRNLITHLRVHIDFKNHTKARRLPKTPQRHSAFESLDSAITAVILAVSKDKDG